MRWEEEAVHAQEDGGRFVQKAADMDETFTFICMIFDDLKVRLFNRP